MAKQYTTSRTSRRNGTKAKIRRKCQRATTATVRQARKTR